MYQVYLYFLYSFVIFFITFVPGYLILYKNKNLDYPELVILSPLISIIVLLLVSFFFTSKVVIIFWLLLAVIFVLHMYSAKSGKSLISRDNDGKFLIQLVFLFFGVRILAQTLWEFPVIGGDWSYHGFVLPYQFSLGDWTPPRDRPPLFSLLIYAYHMLLGTSLYQFWVTQGVSTILNSIFILPAYFIARKSFGVWVARVSVLFMVFVPFLVFQSVYTWPKSIAMYCVLAMIYFLFLSGSKNKYLFAGLLGGFGFLFHNYVAFYILISVVLLILPAFNQTTITSKTSIIKNFINKEKLKNILLYLLPAFLVVLPYFLWLYSYYGTFSTSRFIYYPFAVGGYDTALSGDLYQLFKTFHETPFSEIIFIRLSNLLVTITPAALPINPIATSFPTYNPIYYFSHDYPGALSASIYILSLLWFIDFFRSRRKDTKTKILVLFVFFPLAINLSLWGWREWGLVGQILHPTVPLIVMFATKRLKKILTKYERLYAPLILFVLIDLIAENLIFKQLLERFYYSIGGITDVYSGITRFITEFRSENFVSAYFIFQNMHFVISLSLSGLTLWTAYLLLKKQKFTDNTGDSN